MRTILHVDMNNYYASVECLYHPELRDKPVAVCGNPELRHGIVLAKNMPAKNCGVKTGDAIWEARQKCRELVVVPPHFDTYLRFSRLAREIYAEYTDQVEPFGLDECWLDVTGSEGLYGSGVAIADALRDRIREELGITASVGVSFNKIFAKLGSDMRKPDATTTIPRKGWEDVVWPLPVASLLCVGPATARKLGRYYVRTIGDLAASDPAFLHHLLGKNGITLQWFALGLDSSPVTAIGAMPLVKSVGNSTTAPRDLTADGEVRVTLYSLAESVAARLWEQGCRCTVVTLHTRDSALCSLSRQTRLPFPSCALGDIVQAAYDLFERQYPGDYSIRSLGIQASGLISADYQQTSLHPDVRRSQAREEIENTIDNIRHRFGYDSIKRGVMLTAPDLAINPKEEHVIHPLSYTR